MDENMMEPILKRLDVIVCLMLEGDSNKGVSVTDKVVRLSDLGLSAIEISRIVRKPGNQVRDILAKRRKKSAK